MSKRVSARPKRRIKIWTPEQAKSRYEMNHGDEAAQIERHAKATCSGKGNLVGLSPILVDVSRWRSNTPLIQELIKSFQENGWIVEVDQNKDHCHLHARDKWKVTLRVPNTSVGVGSPVETKAASNAAKPRKAAATNTTNNTTSKSTTKKQAARSSR